MVAGLAERQVREHLANIGAEIAQHGGSDIHVGFSRTGVVTPMTDGGKVLVDRAD
jgi:hypothetical protein